MNKFWLSRTYLAQNEKASWNASYISKQFNGFLRKMEAAKSYIILEILSSDQSTKFNFAGLRY